MIPGRVVWTIGHANHPWDDFLALLRRSEISAVADVRSSPYTRFRHFTRPALERALPPAGVAYRFLGTHLGGRLADPACYRDGRVSYPLLAATATFRDGVDLLVALARTGRVAVLCAEGDPLRCHRTLLIAPALTERGLAVRHIGPDGRVEGHEDALRRLVGVQDDLFGSPDEFIGPAMAARQARLSYRPDPGPRAPYPHRTRQDPSGVDRGTSHQPDHARRA